jgi:DNA-binding CsgD family transcriptional regulator/PAS domain-containing protein
MKEQKGIIGVPYRSVRTGNPVLAFTALLRGTSDQVLGLLGCSVQLNSPLALEGIRQTRIGQTEYIYIYDTARLMILHPRSERIIKRYVKPGTTGCSMPPIEGFEGVGETVNSLGIPMLVSFKHVPGINWIVGAQQTQSEAFAPIRAARERLIYGIIIAVAITVLVVSVVVRGITKPILKLREATVLFDAENGPGKDEYKKELESIRQRDEIGDLARTFRDICDRLDKTMVSLKNYAMDWERTFNSVSDAIFILDREDRIMRLNRSAVNLRNIKPEDAVGQSFYKLMHGVDEKPDYYPGRESLITGKPHSIEAKGIPGHIFKITFMSLVNELGEIVGTVCTAKDTTYQKRLGDALRKRERSLELKSRNLEEANIALKILLKHNDDHNVELEERVLHNVRKLVLPYVENLKRSKLDVKQTTYLEIIETNLNEIISPVSKRLSSKYFNLTPREIQLANLIKDDKTNKDIAELLNISLRAVEFYRENIRKKLGLTYKKINLKSHLLAYKS